MGKMRFFVLVTIIASLGIIGAEAQTQSHPGMTLSGATGLYSVPSGRIAWDRNRDSDLGLDFGYHAVIHDGEATHIPKLALSLFKWVEVSAAFDFQPDNYNSILYYPDDYGRENDNGNNTDFLGGLKVQLPLEKAAIAVGGNLQALNLGNKARGYMAGQIYVAATYPGSFFDMPAETTLTLGKTFIEDYSNSDIDYGMGFDIELFPNQLQGILHWITDFSNFSYSVEAFGADAWYRGVLNTGLRFDLSRIKQLNKFRFAVDVMITDLLDDGRKDEGRAFSFGVVFGIPIL